MIIDAKDKIVGRFATVAAKRAMEGEEVSVINCEEAVVSGSKDEVFARFRQRRERTVPLKGPYFPRQSDRIVKRMIRGMLPYKTPRGRDALAKVKCYCGVPEELKDAKTETIQGADIGKLPSIRFVPIRKISEFLGGVR
ncbi:MAG: 50S ribosomal protein L13 [Nanoarchaeota archaeon]